MALLREIGQVLGETVDAFMTDKVMRLAAAVAFYTALSLAPLLVVILSVAQIFWRDEEARTELAGQIDQILGPQAAEAVHVALAAAQNGDQSGMAALAGIGALLFGASLLFAQLKDALNAVWHVEPQPGKIVRGFVRKRVLALMVVFGIGVLLLASLLATAIFNALLAQLELFEWAAEVRQWRIVTIGITVAGATVLFAMLFEVLPDADISWRDVWLGALLTAVLFTLSKELIALYLGRAAVGSGYGAAGSLVAMLMWVYLSAIVFFLGAEITQVLARRYGRGISPSEGARWIPGTPEAERHATSTAD